MIYRLCCWHDQILGVKWFLLWLLQIPWSVMMCLRRFVGAIHWACCNISTWTFVLRTLGLVGLYFSFSIALTFFQNWLIKGYPFPYPLSIVMCHLVVKFILAAVVREMMQCYNGKERVQLEWSIYYRNLSIAGIASALDIGLSNWSFKYLTVSLYTMAKSSCIIFIMMFAVFFKLEALRVSLVLVVLLISVGLFLFTYHSTQFHLFGFVLVMIASLMGGLRWTVAQLVMQKNEIGLNNPIDMMYFIQPWMLLGILPLAIPIEGLGLLSSPFVFRFHDSHVVIQTATLVLTGSLLAFLMELSEFLILTYNSSLTLSITGIVKEICTLYLGVHLNGDKMNLVNKFGLVISLVGITFHVFMKSVRKPDQERTDTEAIAVPLLRASLNDTDEEDIVYDAQKRV